MFKHAFITLTIAVALTSACRGKAEDVNTNAGTNPRDAATAGAAQSTPAQPSALSVTDQQFVQKAAEGGRREVELGRLAQQHASTDAVRQLGQRIADDHERANRELESSLGGADVARTSGTSDNDSDRNKLEKMTGAAFDRAYVDMMISDHQKDITEFEGASRSANETVKNFAEKTLPTLHEHLTQARDAKATLEKSK